MRILWLGEGEIVGRGRVYEENAMLKCRPFLSLKKTPYALTAFTTSESSGSAIITGPASEALLGWENGRMCHGMHKLRAVCRGVKEADTLVE